MADLPSFMHDIEAKIKGLKHGNYPTIAERTTADAPYSPRHAHESGHKEAPKTDKAGPNSKASKGTSRQAGKRTRKGK